MIRDPNGKGLLAAGALHVEWRDLAEIKSLVVDPGTQGKGLGRIVVDACLEEAAEMGLKTVFALTTTPAFFERLGFKISGVSAFPRKVWNECFRCPKYHACDEIAVTIDLRERDFCVGLSLPRAIRHSREGGNLVSRSGRQGARFQAEPGMTESGLE